MRSSCAHCRQAFEVSDADMAFLEKVAPTFHGKKEAIPPPTLCPDCRHQRRITFRNERSFHHRKCDRTGKSIISVYPAGTTFPVFETTEWTSDAWDPLEYGQAFDPSRSFFEQFQELCGRIPHASLTRDPRLDENSDYTNCAGNSKNCYLIFQAEHNENCYYSRGINHCKDCCDCLRVNDCELCYEGINLSSCYRCFFSQDCDHCSDCWFSSELRGCRNCFGCHGLVHKEYYIFNEPHSREEWEKKILALTITPDVIRQMSKQSLETKHRIPQRFAHLIQCENVTGDHVIESRNCRSVFDSKGLEDCVYCYELLNGAKDCMDYSMWGENAELLYECSECGNTAHTCLSCSQCWQNVRNMYYCLFCMRSCHDCFGCFGLKHREFCVLNKQYTKEEYEKLVSTIIAKMRDDKEWGEFFPTTLSPFGYNETLAYELFPMTKEEVVQRGWKWQEDQEASKNYLGPNIEPPSNIEEVSDDICQQILQCEVTGKPYKIIEQELKFYRDMKIPIPRRSPEQRHKERTALRNPQKLWKRKCMKCAREMQTTYAPDRSEMVYCDECYLQTVY